MSEEKAPHEVAGGAVHALLESCCPSEKEEKEERKLMVMSLPKERGTNALESFPGFPPLHDEDDETLPARRPQ